MKTDLYFAVAPSATAPVAGIKLVEPSHVNDAAKCEVNINVGIFFDGTNNNRKRDAPKLGHTNIARLFNAYREDETNGYFKIYIPGVGTEFPEINEQGESSLGSGFAIGCEERVLYALLQVLSAINDRVFPGSLLFSEMQIVALCRNVSIEDRKRPIEETEALQSLGLLYGLRTLGVSDDNQAEREKILKGLVVRLEKKLLGRKPRVTECFIDVIGFSRGAAQARVFCSWLDAILSGGKLAGVRIHFRFLGVMDTVASAGFWASMVGEGHGSWADPKYLRIPASVRNCVHFVAMHELRKNFPLDSVSINGVLPPQCQEFTYPGAHSDVGGGYPPSALGIAVGKTVFEGDALKLAQIPLNHQLECAVAAGVPMTKERAGTPVFSSPFAIAPEVKKAFAEFLALSTMKPRPMHEWLQPYLNWRWEVRKTYSSLEHVQKANASDKALLIKFNEYLISDAALLRRALWKKAARAMPIFGAKGILDVASQWVFDPEASAALAIAEAAAPTAPAAHRMFDGFVHDSMAGFNLKSCELTGYWRYRKGFLGNNKRLIVENDDADGSMTNMA
jgi:uncharacterized protein (DUF2235 family)